VGSCICHSRIALPTPIADVLVTIEMRVWKPWSAAANFRHARTSFRKFGRSDQEIVCRRPARSAAATARPS
jgi:hypothetical protein